MKIGLLLAAASLALSTSCRAFQVRSDAGPLHGLPFYAKRGYQEQTTVVTRTWTNVTLEVTALPVEEDEDSDKGSDGSDRGASHVAGDRPQAGNPAAEKEKRVETRVTVAIPDRLWSESKAQIWLSGAKADDSAKDLMNGLLTSLDATPLDAAALVEAAKPKPRPPDGVEETVVSNGTELAHEVDYTQVLYYNVQAPAFGAADASVKFAGDGTLTEATAEVDASELADVLPISSLLSEKVFSLAAAWVPLEGEPAREVTIEAKQAGYRFTLKRRHELPLSEAAPVAPGAPVHRAGKARAYAGLPTQQPVPWNHAPLKFETADSFVRSSLEAKSSSKPSEPVYDISASIVQPKKK